MKAAELDRAWLKLGFELKDGRDRWVHLRVDGKLVISTRRSHGSGDLPGKIQHFVRQQMKLNEDQFREALDCPLKREGYLDILRAKGILAGGSGGGVQR